MPTKLKDRPRYIFLEEGDIIKNGDEIYRCEEWVRILKDQETQEYIGTPVTYSDSTIRRKVKQ